uniref:Protein kinase domain-containing protein n=1 Tax=Oryza meridionalis TaxID=40149 RepID=A0A0E0ER72_9ORYZ
MFGVYATGSLSIDCGLDKKEGVKYSDTLDNITYIPDDLYVDTGKKCNVDADSQGNWGPNYRTLRTLRSFPSASGERNCYTLPTVVGANYLVRMEFLYGNYDNKNSQTLEFNLTIGANHWDTVNLNTSSDNNGYKAYEAIFAAWASWAPLCLVNTDGGTPFVSTVELRPLGSLPYPVAMGYQSLSLYRRWNMAPSHDDIIRYPDDVYDRYWYPLETNSDPSYSKIDSDSSIPDSATFAVPSAVLGTAFVPASNNTALIFIPSEARSQENLMVFLHYADFQNGKLRQFDAYINDWQFGTFIPTYLTGVSNFSARWTLANEDGFNLTLAANPESELPPMINAVEVYCLISHDVSRTTLSQDCKSRSPFSIIPTINQCANSTNDPPRVPDLMGALGGRKNHWEHLQKPENRRFTYDELEKLTDNFKRLIGHGGFGHVYYGCLEDSTEVAVKMRSELSSHGLEEFIAEVKSLTKVHHKNLVYLVGYCWEKDHLALVYEYMSQGNLCDYLRVHVRMHKGKAGVDKTMNWVTRVRVVLEAAQGLDYLHKGCSLPIIHSDVKTSNILLGPNLNAKIADFGLSKTFHRDSQSHISATAAGSVGYIDPEYYYTGRLTESSDVYGFGVVLLEVATGEPPILPGQGHIVQRVKQKIVAGSINSIADARLRGAYDTSSMWKVVETAMLCTADIAAQRPTMATVVAQLKESLALEEFQGVRGNLENPASDSTSSMSTFGPSPR